MTCIAALALLGLCQLPPPDPAMRAADDPRVRAASSCLLLGGGKGCFRESDFRDPRCDTPARYEAMSEGEDCSEGKRQ